MGFADMHIHSVYSDGSFLPERIVREARMRNVSLISVCDHNVIEGTLQTAQLAKEFGITCITGVEIDCMFHDRDMHLLCYGADLQNKTLLGRIRHARAALDGMSITLLQRMRDDGFALEPEEYNAFSHDSSLGGWKMLQYLVSKHIVNEMQEAFSFYDRYSVTYESAGFDTAETVVSDIHSAGGFAVLAHPGVTFSTDNITYFEKELNTVLDTGVDGIECYYPRHGKGITQTCLRICSSRGKMITAGSDCHGAFNKNEIGCTRTAVEKLDLRGLL